MKCKFQEGDRVVWISNSSNNRYPWCPEDGAIGIVMLVCADDSYHDLVHVKWNKPIPYGGKTEHGYHAYRLRHANTAGF